MWRLSSFSLRNATLIIVAIVMLAAGGIYSAFNLKQEAFPDISFPDVIITTVYPGASPTDVLTDVSKPMESAVSGVNGIQQVSSQSSEGVSTVIAEFDVNADSKQAQQDVEDAIKNVQLPATAQTPIVSRISFSAFPVLELSLEATSGNPDLRTIAQNDVIPELSNITGVGKIDLIGAPVQQVLVKLNPASLAAKNISVQAITTSLQADGLSIPTGELTIDGKSNPVRVTAPYTSLDDIKNIPLGASAAGVIHLGDVADVTLGQLQGNSIFRTDGKTSFGINIVKTPEANTVDLVNALKAKFNDINKNLPSNVKLATFLDGSTSIVTSVTGISRDALIGAVLAVIIIFLFLGNIRATIVAIVSIPLAMLISLILMYAFGISLNVLSLGGLAVATGRVVDDSIVVIENIFRRITRRTEGHLDDMTIAGAALIGTKEVSNAITSSTLTTVAVFLPLAFAAGFVSKFFVPFAYTVTFALASSLLVALTVVPLLTKWLFAHGVKEASHEFILARVYRPVLGWCLKSWVTKFATLAIVVIVFGFSLLSVSHLGSTFVPADNRGATIMVNVQMPAGTSLNITNDATMQIEQMVQNKSGVKSYETQVGTFGGNFGDLGSGATRSELATITITTNDGVDAKPIADSLRTATKNLTADGFTATVNVAIQSYGPPSGGVQIAISGNDDTQIADAANKIVNSLQSVNGITNIKSDLSNSKPEIEVQVDRNKAAAHGLNPALVANSLRGILNQQTVTQADLGSGKTSVIVYFDTSIYSNISAIQNIPVPTLTGGTVPLSSVAAITTGSSPATISRLNQQDTAQVTADITSKNAGQVNTEISNTLKNLNLPSTLTVKDIGEADNQNSAFGDLFIAMGVAVFLVLFLMIITFRSIMPPLSILCSLPVAAIGVFLALFITSQQISISVLIGMLMLIGIVVTNAIVLVDKVQQLREGQETGIPLKKKEALIEAGALRLRPILMTAVATIFALVPLATGDTQGALISQSLAIAVIGGLFTSTVLTLVVVPVVYSLIVPEHKFETHDEYFGASVTAVLTAK